ncbi:MAG: 3-phosphoshikimate 1-carboxyvinyltransferase [Proteobacteria bacterium]|nr:3-phosphoshikimate 1-carboxyvinyltransferase [SAR86 cluster bacterium]MDA0344800.1 3-phosphoshikimate 1-carboxyvinyltransferase [Pseudomonadota bacterium]
MTPIRVKSAKNFSGQIDLPLDKSIAQRAFILGLPTNNGLFGEDITSTKKAVSESNSDQAKKDLFLGNSGTGIRLLTGFLSGIGKSFTLSGDKSLNSRPMARIADPLNLMGANISLTNGKAPIEINPARLKDEFSYVMPVASAQLKSSLLLAALNARTKIEILEPTETRNHTELMLLHLEAGLKIEKTDKGNLISLDGAKGYKEKPIFVPGDFSSASFFIALGLLAPDSKLFIPNVGLNSTRIAFLQLLKEMEAQIEIKNKRIKNRELMADLVVQSSKINLKSVPNYLVPNLIDEIPILSVIAAFSDGKLKLEGIGELRVKESNRLEAIQEILSTLGVEYYQENDSLEITGAGKHFTFDGGSFNSFGDHRIAMCAAISAVRSTGEVLIDDIESIVTSFPNFFSNLERLGFKLINL